MQSPCLTEPSFHVAIIMDGNGRWAMRRGLPRTAGHKAGGEALRRVCEAAPDLGVTTLTVFAFSTYNWARPRAEVAGLMRLFAHYMDREAAYCLERGARLSLIGRRDRLPRRLVARMAEVEAMTAHGRGLHLRIALDYSAREAIERAALEGADRFACRVAQADDDSATDVDLMIRTGGDRRLSDFLLWECAFAELCFTDQMWPDFDGESLAEAVGEFRTRRRAGGLIGGVLQPDLKHLSRREREGPMRSMGG
jgi:undecaprenyl diphosphate synthase